MKKDYPIVDGHRLQYVREPIEVTEKIIKQAEGQVLHKLKLGKFIAVDVHLSGYKFLPACHPFDKEEDCQKACDSHNSWIGFTKDEADQIIYKSMKNSNEKE